MEDSGGAREDSVGRLSTSKQSRVNFDSSVLTCILAGPMTADLKPAGLADLSCMFRTDEAEAGTSHLICPHSGCEKDTIIIVSPQRDERYSRSIREDICQ